MSSRREASRATGFDLQARYVLGNFSFQKLAIVKDLNELLEELARHDIIAGIAGDQTAAELLGEKIRIDMPVPLRANAHVFLIKYIGAGEVSFLEALSNVRSEQIPVTEFRRGPDFNVATRIFFELDVELVREAQEEGRTPPPKVTDIKTRLPVLKGNFKL
jgi:hypothetical protein